MSTRKIKTYNRKNWKSFLLWCKSCGFVFKGLQGFDGKRLWIDYKLKTGQALTVADLFFNEGERRYKEWKENTTANLVARTITKLEKARSFIQYDNPSQLAEIDKLKRLYKTLRVAS